MKIDEVAAYPDVHVGPGGERTVTHAPDMIRIDPDALSKLFKRLGAAEPDVRGPDGTIVLDSAGECRYAPAEPRRPADGRSTFRTYARI